MVQVEVNKCGLINQITGYVPLGDSDIIKETEKAVNLLFTTDSCGSTTSVWFPKSVLYIHDNGRQIFCKKSWVTRNMLWRYIEQ